MTDMTDSSAGLGSLPKVHPLGYRAAISGDEKTVTTNSTTYTKRYKLLTAAQDLMARDDHRVCMCSKSPNPMSVDAIAVTAETESGGRASWAGLIKCGSVWACPVCAAKISEERREEMSRALDAAKARGYGVGMLTLTIQHNRSQSARDVLTKLRGALRRFVSARRWRNWKDAHNVVGSVRAVEVTYGDSGWHWHAHYLIFTASIVDAEDELTHEMRTHWQRCCERENGWCHLEHGMNYRFASNSLGEKYIADYVAKFGKLPEEIRSEGWDESHEIAKASSKVAKTESGRTPFELLANYADGDYHAGGLFVDYVRAVKHQRQLVWSQGLRDDLLDAADDLLTDEQIADNVEPVVLAEVSDSLFNVLVRYRQRGVALDIASSGGKAALIRWLDEFQTRLDTEWAVAARGEIGNFKYVVQYQSSSGLYRSGVWRRGQNVKAPVWRSTELFHTEHRAIYAAAAAAQQLANQYNTAVEK